MSQKIYFCGSVRQNKEDLQLYQRIITQCSKYGRVINSNVANQELEDQHPLGHKDIEEIYEQCMEKLRRCDVVVAEVSRISIGVGYELGHAVSMNKKVICLYRPSLNKENGQLSYMLDGIKRSDKFQIHYYEGKDACNVIRNVFEDKLKIYFCGSIRGGRQDAPLYAQLVAKLKEYGTVLTEHIANPLISEDSIEDAKDPERIHAQDLKWLMECDIVVAEVTQPSLGVGYEIGRAVEFNKKIVCLFRPDSDKKLSCMIDGIPQSDHYTVIHYREEDVTNVVEGIFKNYKR